MSDDVDDDLAHPGPWTYGRRMTDFEVRMASIYFLCVCGSPRMPRYKVTGGPGSAEPLTVEYGVVCLWNGHSDIGPV